jgi:hypothetical protein
MTNHQGSLALCGLVAVTQPIPRPVRVAVAVSRPTGDNIFTTPNPITPVLPDPFDRLDAP